MHKLVWEFNLIPLGPRPPQVAAAGPPDAWAGSALGGRVVCWVGGKGALSDFWGTGCTFLPPTPLPTATVNVEYRRWEGGV